jgi:hypothetical protein
MIYIEFKTNTIFPNLNFYEFFPNLNFDVV